MPLAHSLQDDHSARTKIFDTLFHDFHDAAFAIRSADGWCWQSSSHQPPQCTLVIHTAAAWNALMEDPTERTLGEAFIDGDLDVEGDLFAVFPVVHFLLSHPFGSRHALLRALWRSSADFARLLRHGPRHSRQRDQAAIAYHYDLPVDFFRPWLGPTLAYSCAYFRSPDDSLDIAQVNKMELICRKLDLHPGDRFLDIGCGWGSLILYAAGQHGAQAHGITLSRSQAAVAAERIRQAGLRDTCEARLLDYRELPAHRDYDKIASVGMFEHVGRKRLAEYFSIARRSLSPQGVFLNHGIARSATVPPARDSFIDRYVFPDGELLPLGEIIASAETAGFEVQDVDNLRSHYERTLRLWVENLRRHAEIVRRYASERTFRIWILYMAGSADAFRRGNIELYQVLLHPRPARVLPSAPLREHWYRDWSTTAIPSSLPLPGIASLAPDPSTPQARAAETP